LEDEEMRFRKGLLFILSFIVLFIGMSCRSVIAAEVGEISTSPEDGWQRINDTDKNINYKGNWIYATTTGVYSGDHTYMKIPDNWTEDAKICFKFYGSQIRIIDISANVRTDAYIIIDGIAYYYDEYLKGVERQEQTIVYEKLDLVLGVHTVEIQPIYHESNYLDEREVSFISLDAIDIDEDGYLVPYSKVTNLEATGGDEEVTLSWDSVEDAEEYKVYWGKKSGDYINSIIVSSDSYKGYTIEDLDNDTRYYFAVSALIDDVEKELSYEASARTDEEVIVTTGSALLIITMTNGKVNEYEVSLTEVDDFIVWLTGSSESDSIPYYKFEKEYNIGPFSSRVDYILSDKILQFEVMEY